MYRSHPPASMRKHKRDEGRIDTTAEYTGNCIPLTGLADYRLLPNVEMLTKNRKDGGIVAYKVIVTI